MKLIDSCHFVCLYCAPNSYPLLSRSGAGDAHRAEDRLGAPRKAPLARQKVADLYLPCMAARSQNPDRGAARSSRGVFDVRRKHSERSTGARLTEQKASPRVALSCRGFRACGAENDSTFADHESFLHSRDVSVLLWLLHDAGVFLGIDSDITTDLRRPTRPTARWVFCFAANHESFEGQKKHRWRSG